MGKRIVPPVVRYYSVPKTVPQVDHAGYAAQVAKLPPTSAQARLDEMAREGFCVRRFVAGLEVYEKPGSRERRAFSLAAGEWREQPLAAGH